MIFADDAAFGADDANEGLLFGVAYGNHQASADGELLDERLWNFWAAGGDQYAVIRCVLAPADGAVKPLHRRVVTTEPPDVRLGGARQVAQAFECEDAARDCREHCRLIAGAGADFK